MKVFNKPERTQIRGGWTRDFTESSGTMKEFQKDKERNNVRELL